MNHRGPILTMGGRYAGGGGGGPLAIAIAGGYPYEFAEGEFGWNLGEFGTRSVPGNAKREKKERGNL